MGTTGSTPAASTAVDRKPGGSSGSKTTKKNVPPPPIKHQQQHTATSSPALKKNPKNYVDMGIEDEGGEPERGVFVCSVVCVVAR